MATHLLRRASEETEGEDAAVSCHKFFFCARVLNACKPILSLVRLSLFLASFLSSLKEVAQATS
jgi:hypothetical protein